MDRAGPTRVTIDRRVWLRGVVGGLALAILPGSVRGQSAANQWFAVQGDDGHPVPNMRAPVELVEEIEDLAGAIWSGPVSAAVKLVEFYDYNCPWCRAADAAREALRRAEPDLRVGLVNNPILSPGSLQAAKVDLALLALKGAGASYALHRRLFATPGRIDGPRALDAAAALGHDRATVERAADGDEVRATLRRQMRLAASLGIVATPSYVVAGAVVLGFPGPKSLAAMVAKAGDCGAIAC